MNVIEAAKVAGLEQVIRHKDGSSTVLPTALFERFAQIIRNQALEDAASLCAGYWAGYAASARRLHGQHATHAAGQRDGANACSSAIRAMKKEQS